MFFISVKTCLHDFVNRFFTDLGNNSYHRLQNFFLKPVILYPNYTLYLIKNYE